MSIVSDRYRGTKEYALVYTELVTAARYRGTVTYQEIAKLVGLPMTGNYMSKEVGSLLGAISEDEVVHGRPMLSAIGVSKQGAVGGGFYTLAKELGLFDGGEEQEFLKDQRQKVYDTWKVVIKTKE